MTDTLTCPVCTRPIKDGDACSTDIELGICHALCLVGSTVVDLDTGEPIDGEIGVFIYRDNDND